MFSSKLLRRLYTGYAAIILISMLIVGILLTRQLSENSLTTIQNSLYARAELLAEIAKDSLKGPPSVAINNNLQARLAALEIGTESRLTAISIDGRIIADSWEQSETTDNYLQRPEIIAAMDSGTGITSRYSQTLQQMMIYHATTVTSDDQVVGYVRVAIPQTGVDVQLVQLRLIILLSLGIVVIAALTLGLYFAKRFINPLLRITETSEAISQGDYSRRVRVEQQDEMGSLASAINRMAEGSAQRMTDITLERNRLTNMFAGMVEGVIDVDQHQSIVHINQVAADLLGLSVANCIQEPIWEKVRFSEILTALEETLNTRKIVKAQMRRPSVEDDQVVDIYAAALHNEDQESTGAIIVLHDISELDHLERIRRDFVANASHELKTPITAIRGLSETIITDTKMQKDVRRDFIEKIHKQSLRLSSLVTDLMTISRLESDHPENSFESFDFVGLVQSSINASAEIFQEKQLDLSLNLPDEPLMIKGEIQAINQLIYNLIDNATKYTETGGSVNIGLRIEQDKALFTVEDSGIGISPQLQQRIFERFYRVDKARSRELGGTGLGLSIVKNITEQHGGSVSVESQLGRGSTFSILLPLD